MLITLLYLTIQFGRLIDKKLTRSDFSLHLERENYQYPYALHAHEGSQRLIKICKVNLDCNENVVRHLNHLEMTGGFA